MKGVHHVALTVSDLSQSRPWYRDAGTYKWVSLSFRDLDNNALELFVLGPAS